MKIIFLTLLLSFSVVGAYAQTSINSSGAPHIKVIKKKWRFQVRNPLMDESPFLAMEERVQDEQDLKDTAGVNNPSAKLGLRPIKRPEHPPAERKDAHVSATYIYEIKIKNTGNKAVSALILEYLFFDANTKQLLSRKRLTSKNNIASGKTTNLVFRSVSPPTGTISAKNAGKKSRERYFEQVVIQSVEYADGSKWQASIKNQ